MIDLIKENAGWIILGLCVIAGVIIFSTGILSGSKITGGEDETPNQPRQQRVKEPRVKHTWGMNWPTAICTTFFVLLIVNGVWIHWNSLAGIRDHVPHGGSHHQSSAPLYSSSAAETPANCTEDANDFPVTKGDTTRIGIDPQCREHVDGYTNSSLFQTFDVACEDSNGNPHPWTDEGCKVRSALLLTLKQDAPEDLHSVHVRFSNP